MYNLRSKQLESNNTIVLLLSAPMPKSSSSSVVRAVD